MTRVVADASAFVEYLLGSTIGNVVKETIEDPGVDLHTPALCDVEVASALRGLLAGKKLTIARAFEATSDFANLPVTRHGHLAFIDRILALRHNFSAYDATYVALAEALDARLLTCDVPLAQSVGKHAASLELVPVVVPDDG